MTHVIGIDCAVQPKATGLALAVVDEQQLVVQEVRTGSNSEPPAVTAATWVRENPKVLIAIDAPLGWPVDLGPALSEHGAGEALHLDSHQLFRRETDRFVKKLLGRQTLDVGADRIARTAHSAVNLVGQIRAATRRELPLLWDNKDAPDGGVIEVYPAGTLCAYGLPCSGYKKTKNRRARESLVSEIGRLMSLGDTEADLIEDDNRLDAAICCLAAWDFRRGLAAPPSDLEKAKKEGWIWVRNPAV